MRKITAVSLMLLSLNTLAQSPYEQGAALYKEGRWEAALPFLNEAVSIYPDSYPTLFMRGRTYLKLKQFPLALNDFNDMLTLELSKTQILATKYMIGKTLMAAGNYQKAEAVFTPLLEVSPKARRFDLQFNIAQCRLNTAKSLTTSNLTQASHWYGLAAEALTATIKENPPVDRLSEVRYLRAHTLYRQGQHTQKDEILAEAFAECERALELNPNETKTFGLLVSIGFTRCGSAPKQDRERFFAQTAIWLKQYHQVSPNDTEVTLKLGKALQGAGDFTESVAILKPLAKQFPERGDIHFALGASQMAAKNYAAATLSFDKALTYGESDNVAAWQYKAACLVNRKGDCYQTDIPLYEEAVSCLERGIVKIKGAEAQLSGPLERNRKNLATLRENLEIDNRNHAAAVENLVNLKKTINANLAKLEYNRDLQIKQPTRELAAVIEELKQLIQADRARLDQETTLVKSYLKQVDACGGKGSFSHYQDMKMLLAGN